MDSHRQDTKVQFHPKAKLRMYVMPNEEDRQASWYSHKDFFMFRKERAENVQTIRRLGIQEAERQFSITSIGIRSNLNAHVRQVREMRRDSKVFQVLQEQQRQHKHGIRDPEAIAASCRHISVASSAEACKEAQRVQDLCLEVYAEDTLLGQAMCFSSAHKLSDFTPPPGRKRALVAIAEQPPLIPTRTFRRSASAA